MGGGGERVDGGVGGTERVYLFFWAVAHMPCKDSATGKKHASKKALRGRSVGDSAFVVVFSEMK